jgi:hypothetical protein
MGVAVVAVADAATAAEVAAVAAKWDEGAAFAWQAAIKKTTGMERPVRIVMAYLDCDGGPDRLATLAATREHDLCQGRSTP